MHSSRRRSRRGRPIVQHHDRDEQQRPRTPACARTPGARREGRPAAGAALPPRSAGSRRRRCGTRSPRAAPTVRRTRAAPSAPIAPPGAGGAGHRARPRVGGVERGVHERVGVGVLGTRDVPEVDLARRRASNARTSSHSGRRCGCFTFHAPSTCRITSMESARTMHAPARERTRGLEPGDQRAVLGDVVRGRADALAHRRQPRRRRGGRVEDDRADRGGSRVPPGPAVAEDQDGVAFGCGHALTGSRAALMGSSAALMGSGWRRSCRSRRRLPSGALRMRSTSVAGIVR